MKKKRLLIIIGIVVLLFLLLLSMRIIRKHQSLPLLDTPGKKVKWIKTLTDDGGRVAWSPKGDLIAFDREGDDGYYDVWTMKPDGSDQRCLTCNNPQVPQKHNGQPAWHSSGKYIIFQAQDPNLKGLPRILGRIEKTLTGPGVGVNNNLWLMDSSGEKFWQLTNIPDKMATLHPHFSNDGAKLLWSERISNEPKPVGQWVIKIADFVLDEDQPYLTNIQEYRPGDMQFYETHGFFPDDHKIIFSATKDGIYSHLDVYSLDLAGQKLEALTDPSLNQWDEHAQISPNGEKIVWMSSMEIEQEIKQYEVKTDYWIMNADGSEKQRITYFNDPTAPEYMPTPDGFAAADNSWSSDGKKLVAYLINRSTRKDVVVLIELE